MKKQKLELENLFVMARPSRHRKTPSQKHIEDAVIVAAGDTTAVFSGAAAFGEPIKDFKGRVRTSSGDAQSTAIYATRPRADSISVIELNEMATKQLLAELQSITASPRTMRSSVFSISTKSLESTLATGSQKIPTSLVKALPYSVGAMILFVSLVSFFGLATAESP